MRHFCLLGWIWLSMMLAGCATTLSTQVTRFQAWSPELAQSSFAFVRPVDPSRELEQASYEAAVAAVLHRLGLQRAGPGQAARIQVDMSISAQLDSRAVLRPVYQEVPVFRPAWRDRAGRLHPAYWGPDPSGPRLVGHQQLLAAVQVSTLRLRLLDAAAQPQPLRTVFESTARHEADASLPLAQLAPWLVRAVFVDFPGHNGQVSTVRFDTQTGQVLRPR